MFLYDPTFFFLIPVLIFAGWAQMKVSSTFKAASHVETRRRYTGAQAAQAILKAEGISDVRVEKVSGYLTDHYDPREKVLRLSERVYDSTSLAAVGVASHEAGHALQHAYHYLPLQFRSCIVPLAQFGSLAAWPLFLLGFLLAIPSLMSVGIIVFTIAVLFQIVTLPVELNASARALKSLPMYGIVADDELPITQKVLNAAALTYVAATLMAIMQLVRLLLLRNMRD